MYNSIHIDLVFVAASQQHEQSLREKIKRNSSCNSNKFNSYLKFHFYSFFASFF